LNLWHALRRECTGAWRSVRYDLATHRATKVAGAYTEEFQPGGPPVPTPSRMVPLTGVTLLLAGGAAGAFLAISGGMAAIGGPDTPALAQEYAAAASTAPVASETSGSGAGTNPVTPRRAAGTTRPSPTPAPSTPPAPPAPPPVVEGTSSASGPSTSASSADPSTSPSPSASQSSGGSTEGPRSRGHRGRR
jgi:hypothetical protein